MPVFVYVCGGGEVGCVRGGGGGEGECKGQWDGYSFKLTKRQIILGMAIVYTTGFTSS